MAETSPNFFIVGAPKCGTTALHAYCAQHPDVFMPARKEPRFFAPDLDSGSARDSKYFVRDVNEYLSLFASGSRRRLRGEATALYLFSNVAAQRIRAFRQDAKIVIMLRDPVELMYAFHSERLYNGNEHIVDFAEALQAERDRRRGQRISRRTVIPQALQYREVATLSTQIERFLAAFDRSAVFFIVFDDFVRDTAAVYRDLLRFLDLDATFTPEFRTHNGNKRVRSYAVRNLIKRPPEFLRNATRAILPTVVRQRIAKDIGRLNVHITPRPHMDPDLRRELRLEFASEVRRLSQIIQRDLSPWSDTHA